MNENKQNLNQKFSSFELEIQKNLDKKANLYEVSTMINIKDDKGNEDLNNKPKVKQSILTF